MKKILLGRKIKKEMSPCASKVKVAKQRKGAIIKDLRKGRKEVN